MRQFGLILALLASSALAMESSSCKTITCSGSTAKSGASCVTVSGSSVSISPCESGLYCNNIYQFQSSEDHESATCASSGSTNDCPTSHNYERSTYLYCCQNADCASNECDTSKNECVGKSSGTSCTSSESCDTDLYCSGETSGTCTSTKSEGSACTFDNECDAGYGCFDSLCVKYFSLPYGTETVGEEFCESGVMANYYCDSVTIKANNVEVSEPWKCTIGQTCTYTYTKNGGQAHTSRNCECDGTGGTTGYCPIRGIEGIKNWSDDLYNKYEYDSSDCSGDYAHVTDLEDVSWLAECNSISQDGVDYYGEYSNIVAAWSLYSSGQIDDCAKDLGLFDPDEDYDSWDSAEFLALSALFILFN